MYDDRLGFYLVGWKKFFNKTLALFESKKTGYDLIWNFNNEVYKEIDWTAEIQVPLTELYRLRALQLRERYDYLVLQYSGGADSNNILHAFIDNGIFLDEICMQLPEPDRKNFNIEDQSARNVNSELTFEAEPHLQKYKNLIHPNTKIRYQDYATPLLKLLEKDNWFEDNPTGTNMCLTGIARQFTQTTDPEMLDLAFKGSTVALIQGVDKPLVHYNGTDYYAYFSDSSAMHNTPVELNQAEIFKKYYKTEFFYWTPDFPEISVKQAQEIKKFAELFPWAREQLKETTKRHIGTFKELLHPIIYPPHTEPFFQTEKPNSQIFRPMDQWFWDSATDRQKDNYLYTINYIGQNIKQQKFIKDDVFNGIQATLSPFYKL